MGKTLHLGMLAFILGEKAFKNISVSVSSVVRVAVGKGRAPRTALPNKIPAADSPAAALSASARPGASATALRREGVAWSHG